MVEPLGSTIVSVIEKGGLDASLTTGDKVDGRLKCSIFESTIPFTADKN